MKTATLEQIGKALGGITKQAVHKEYVKKGFIVKREDGRIDIEDKQNRAFLKSKGADFSVFYPKKTTAPPPKKSKKKETPPPQPNNIKKIDISEYVKKGGKETKLSDAPTLLEIETAKKIEEWRGKKKDNALKDLKLDEEKGRLIDKKIVNNIIFDVLGHIARDIQNTPYSIVDEIVSIAVTQPETAREKIVRLLRDKQAEAMKKAVEEAEKIERKRKYE